MNVKHIILDGNEAIFRGAINARAQFFAGYPISPANEILALAAQYARSNSDFHFIQSEDEIAALGHCIGAALAGLKAFTATAPPGLRLMQEFIGFARHIRCPLVIVNVQRGNASTGLPTQPAQQDIMSVRWGAGGDYETLAFYPNSVLECYEYTIHAFNAASESSSPVILFSDANIAHLVEPISLSAPPIIPLPTVELGLRARWITGLANLANYRSEIRSQQIVIRQAARKYRAFEISGNPTSDRLLISYGAISRTLYYFTDRFAFFRPIRIFPMLEEELRTLADIHSSFIVVEANEGQYAELVERVIGRSVEKIAIYAQDMNRKELLEHELSKFA